MVFSLILAKTIEYCLKNSHNHRVVDVNFDEQKVYIQNQTK